MFKAKIKSPRLLIAVYTKSLDAHTTSFVAFIWVDFNTFLSSRPTLKRKVPLPEKLVFLALFIVLLLQKVLFKVLKKVQ